jgi:AcrR family transcriptional regulator
MTTRPLRADARDNRARILRAGTEVFGTEGPAASTEEVARRAGVGIGTVFRHFPTKQDLLNAVFTTRLEQLRDRARELAAATDPGEAFHTFFREVVAGAPSKLAIAESLTDPTGAAEAGSELREAFGVLLERAQAAGAVRRDVAAPEVFGLMVGISRATRSALSESAVRDKALGVVFDGLTTQNR